MEEKEFKKLIDKNKYQIFLFSCPCGIPISFAAHTWIITNKKGKINRYSGSWIRYPDGKHVSSKSFYKPHEGIYVLPAETKLSFLDKIRWKSKLIKKLDGDVAKKIIKFCERNLNKYPYPEKYHFYPGPNSNTFIQWIIDHFPESGFKLPWNAFGKNYKLKG